MGQPDRARVAWRTAVIKEAPGALAYALYANEGTGRASGHVERRPSATSAAGPVAANAWTHLATTYDGANLRLYVNGTLVATRAMTGAIGATSSPLRFGGNVVWPEYFQGRIDDIRVYNRALTGAEVATDMATPIGQPAPPLLNVTPAGLSFTGAQGGANPAAKTLTVTNAGGGTLSFTAADDAPWLSVSPGSGSAPQDLSVAVSTAGLAPGTYTGSVTVTASGVAGSPATVPVTLTVTPPPPPPALAVAPSSLGFTATAGGTPPAGKAIDVTNTGGGTLSYSASDDAAWLSVAPASGSAPQAVAATVNQAGLAVGTYTATITVTAAGATGSPKTVPVTLTVEQAPPVPTGLVAAYGFDEPSGATATDSSGSGNTGTIRARPAPRVARRRAVVRRVNDWVTVADSASLDLTTGMTLEAWVNPSTINGEWRTVILKERPPGSRTRSTPARTRGGPACTRSRRASSTRAARARSP